MSLLRRQCDVPGHVWTARVSVPRQGRDPRPLHVRVQRHLPPHGGQRPLLHPGEQAISLRLRH